MKASLPPAVVVGVLLVVVAGVIFFLWHGSQGVNSGPGRMQSDLKMDKATQAAQQNPEEFRKQVEESLKKNGVSSGK